MFIVWDHDVFLLLWSRHIQVRQNTSQGLQNAVYCCAVSRCISHATGALTETATQRKIEDTIDDRSYETSGSALLGILALHSGIVCANEFVGILGISLNRFELFGEATIK